MWPKKCTYNSLNGPLDIDKTSQRPSPFRERVGWAFSQSLKRKEKQPIWSQHPLQNMSCVAAQSTTAVYRNVWVWNTSHQLLQLELYTAHKMAATANYRNVRSEAYHKKAVRLLFSLCTTYALFCVRATNTGGCIFYSLFTFTAGQIQTKVAYH